MCLGCFIATLESLESVIGERNRELPNLIEYTYHYTKSFQILKPISVIPGFNCHWDCNLGKQSGWIHTAHSFFLSDMGATDPTFPCRPQRSLCFCTGIHPTHFLHAPNRVSWSIAAVQGTILDGQGLITQMVTAMDGALAANGTAIFHGKVPNAKS